MNCRVLCVCALGSMYEEGTEKCVMSAVRLPDSTFLLSQFENFPAVRVVQRCEGRMGVDGGRYAFVLVVSRHCRPQDYAESGATASTSRSVAAVLR